MSIYLETENGSLYLDGMTIPNTESNRHYRKALQEVQDGVSTITPYSAPVPTNAEKISAMTAVVQGVLNSEAQALGYDDIFTAVSYATSSDPVFGPQGIAFRNWRDSVWNTAHGLLNTWQSGGDEPTEQDVIAALPAFVQP